MVLHEKYNLYPKVDMKQPLVVRLNFCHNIFPTGRNITSYIPKKKYYSGYAGRNKQSGIFILERKNIMELFIIYWNTCTFTPFPADELHSKWCKVDNTFLTLEQNVV